MMKISPFDHNNFIGYVNYASPAFIRVHFPSSTLLNQFHYVGEYFNAGLVGSYVAIEGENFGFIGKIQELSLPEKERIELNEKAFKNDDFHPTGKIEVLLCFDYFNMNTQKGFSQYPAIGSKVYACSEKIIAGFLKDLGKKNEQDDIMLNIANMPSGDSCNISISPQALFGRHCAIVGTTGSGKSFTVAKILEEIINLKGKTILIDPTGEFKKFDDLAQVSSYGFNENLYFKYSNLHLSDLFIMFKPSEQTQLPKLVEAIKSLKLLNIVETKSIKTANDKLLLTYKNAMNALEKKNKPKKVFMTAIKENPESENLNCCFDIKSLPYQIFYECIYDTDRNNSLNYGDVSDRDYGFCQSLISRILYIKQSNDFKKCFGFDDTIGLSDFSEIFDNFINDQNKHLLRISLAKVPFENYIREILVNCIGRFLLSKARKEEFISDEPKSKNRPIIVFIDEAHQFLNKRIKGEFSFDVDLNSFDQIAKECRKYGLFLCLSTQIPRDIPIGTLSQIGTFISHRLINQNDKETIENACPASNKYALSFLPNLGEGEALLMGVDFPMPVIVKIKKPIIEPYLKTPKIFKSNS